MNKGKKFISMMLVMLLTTIVVALSGCVEEEENKIIIGTSADFAPFEYKDAEGKIIGFDIEMVTTILENLNYTVEVKDIAFDSLIPSLNAGTIDVIAAAMTITEEREEQIDFSDPYYEADQSILIKKGSDIQINSTDDLANLTIGAQTGTTGEAWVQENLIDEGLMDEENLKHYELYLDAVQDLDIGPERLDAIILDQPVAKAFTESGTREIAYIILTGESYGLGVREGESDLLEKINKELEEFIDSPEWTTLVNKYFE